MVRKLYFGKQNWTTWDSSWPIPLLRDVSASCVLWNNGLLKFNIVENAIQQRSNMFTTSTSFSFVITLCTKNVARDLAKSNNSGIASSGLERWLHNAMEETMVVCSKNPVETQPSGHGHHETSDILPLVLRCTSSKCSSCSAWLIFSNSLSL